MVDDLLLRHRRDQLQHQLHTLKDLLAPVYGEIIQEIGAIVDRLQILREQSIAHYFVVADMSDLLHVWRQNFDVRPILKFQTNSVEENGNLPSIVNLVAIEAERQLRSACANVHNLKREQIDGLVGVQRSKLTGFVGLVLRHVIRRESLSVLYDLQWNYEFIGREVYMATHPLVRALDYDEFILSKLLRRRIRQHRLERRLVIMLILKLFIEYQIAGFAHDACKLAQETCRTLHSADGQYQHMLFKPKVIVPEILSVNLWRSRQLLQYVHAKIATVAMSQEFIEKRLTTGKHRPTATPFVDSVRELARIVWKFKSIREYEKWVERYRMTRPFRRMLSKAMILNVVKIFVEKLKRDSARVRKYEGMQKEHPLESALDQDDIMRFLLPLVSYHRRHHLAQLDTIRLHFIRRLGALPMLMKSARKMTRLLSKTPHELHSLVFRSMQHVVDAEQSPLGLGFSAELNPADRYLLDNLFRRLTTTTEIKALRILADGDHPFHSLVVEIHERFAIVNMRRVILLEREPLEQESSDTLDSMRFSETSSEVTDYTMRVIYACQFTKYGAKSNKLLALLTQMQDICRHIHEQFKPLRAQFVENEEEEINHRSITTNVVITKDVFVEHASELLEKASWKQHRDHTLRRMLVPTLIGDRIDPPVQNPFLAPYVAYWKSRTFIIKAMTSQTREQLKEVVFRFYKYLSGIDEIVALKQLRRHVKDRQSPRRKKGVVGPRQPSVTQKRKKNLLNISDKHISISSQPTIESIEDKRQEKEPEGIEQKETPDFTSFLQAAAAAAAVGAQRSSTLEIDSYLLETTTAQPATSIPPETVDDVFHRNKPLTQMWTSSVQRVSRVDRTLREKILQQRMRWDQERMEHGMDLLRGRLSTQTNAQQDQEQQRRNLWEQRFQKRDHHSLLSI